MGKLPVWTREGITANIMESSGFMAAELDKRIWITFSRDLYFATEMPYGRGILVVQALGYIPKSLYLLVYRRPAFERPAKYLRARIGAMLIHIGIKLAYTSKAQNEPVIKI